MKVYTHPDYSYVKVVEVPMTELRKIDLSICAQPKETLGSFYNRQTDKPDVLINAGFFGLSNGGTCFNLVDDGVAYGTDTKYQWGFGIPKEHDKLIYGSLASNKSKFVDFISGYPNLVDAGKACSPWTFATEINYKAARSMIGYNDTTIFTVTVGKPGMTFTTMAKLMINLGCKYAINLDGGGSTRMLVKGEVVNTPTENRAVDSVICIYLKENAAFATDQEEYVTYTVVKRDSWWKIAKNLTGSGAKYTKLQKFNNWESNRTLEPGDVIKIPKSLYTGSGADPEPEKVEPTPEPTTPTEPTPVKPDPTPVKPEPTPEVPKVTYPIKGNATVSYEEYENTMYIVFKDDKTGAEIGKLMIAKA